MKRDEIPQDNSPLENFTYELCYVKEKSGKYDTGLSRGWQVKTEALEQAWVMINEEVEEAKQAVLEGKKSPVFFYMKKELMDVSILSGYVGVSKFMVKMHLKPFVFVRLSNVTLGKYAALFKVSVDELKSFKGE